MTAPVTTGAAARFQALYAIAHIGAFVCFVPLINLLLPQRALQLAPGHGVDTLSWALLAGGVAASIANVAAGWLSDRLAAGPGGRFPLLTAGLIATCASYTLIALARQPVALIIAFILFQIAFNLLFAPLVALAADHVADAQKGRLFGWLSMAMPLAQCFVTLLLWSPVDGLASRLVVVAVAAGGLILPLCLFGRRLAGPVIDRSDGATPAPAPAAPAAALARDFAYAWVSRLFIQCGGFAVGAYLFVHLSLLQPDGRDGATAQDIYGNLILISLAGSLVAGLVSGIWSDRSGRRLPFLYATAALVGTGSLILAVGSHWLWLAVGYALFTIGLTAFLTIDGAMITQIVGRGGWRGTRLGIVNLTNTLPAIIVPALSILLAAVVASTTVPLFLLVAAGSCISILCLARISTIK